MPHKTGRPASCFLDKVTVRMSAPPSAAEFAYLKANSKDVRIRSGRLILNSNATLALSIVAPNAIALEILAGQQGAFVNYVEVAADVICTTEDEASALLWQVAAHFVHPRHRHHRMIWQPDGFYTGQRRPGRRFVVYMGMRLFACVRDLPSRPMGSTGFFITTRFGNSDAPRTSCRLL